MPRAIWQDIVLAESNKTVVVEDNHYFPPESVRMEYFQPSAQTSMCSWKGKANYFDIVVNGQVNRDAAWVYKNPYPEAGQIRNRIAFWRGVRVEA